MAYRVPNVKDISIVGTTVMLRAEEPAPKVDNVTRVEFLSIQHPRGDEFVFRLYDVSEGTVNLQDEMVCVVLPAEPRHGKTVVCSGKEFIDKKFPNI